MDDAIGVIEREADGLQVNLEHLPFETDGGVGARASVGLLVLEVDQTIEDEVRTVWPRDGVGLYATRLPNDPMITPETLRAMEARIAPTTALLAPPADLSVIGFGCTSAAMVIGEERVAELVRSVRPGVKVTDPVTAMLAAFRALGVRRIGLLTPYIAEINQAMRAALMARGLDVPAMASFNESDDTVVGRITPASIVAGVERLAALDSCDGVFVSCTSLRVVKIAEEIEARTGKPVTSSNHAMAWHMLRLAGIDDVIPGYGRLYRTPLAG
ncbi:MAG: Asp/Glu racemase [Pseudomonadota bacterium]